MTRTPLVTAMVSVYGADRFIRGCLEDLEAQTIADQIEIVVVDTASPGNEGTVVREFQDRHDNIRYIRTDARETIYGAWNRAIAAGTAPYLTSANTDDRHRPDALERLVDALENRPEAALVYADSAVTVDENRSYDAKWYGQLRWPDFDRRLLFKVCYVGPQPLWRRCLHERYGLFDSDLQVAGDYEFWLRLAINEQFHHLDEVLGLYLFSPASAERRVAKASKNEAEIARERHWPAEWGVRPTPGGYYLRWNWRDLATLLITRRLRPADISR